VAVLVDTARHLTSSANGELSSYPQPPILVAAVTRDPIPAKATSFCAPCCTLKLKSDNYGNGRGSNWARRRNGSNDGGRGVAAVDEEEDVESLWYVERQDPHLQYYPAADGSRTVGTPAVAQYAILRGMDGDRRIVWKEDETTTTDR